MSVGWSVHHFGPDCNIPKTIGWIQLAPNDIGHSDMSYSELSAITLVIPLRLNLFFSIKLWFIKK